MQPPHIWPIEKLIDCLINQHQQAKETIGTVGDNSDPVELHNSKMFLEYTASIIFYLNKLQNP